MNHTNYDYNSSCPRNQYAREPSSTSSSPDSLMQDASVAVNNNNNEQQHQQQYQYCATSPTPTTTTTTTTRATTTHGASASVNVNAYGRRPPRNTLKDRIIRSFNSQCGGSVTSQCGNGINNNGGNDRREESILAAASALASLGVTSPTSSFCSGQQANSLNVSLPTSTSLPSGSVGGGPTPLRRGGCSSAGDYSQRNSHHHHRDSDRNMDMLSLVRPPPSLSSIPSTPPTLQQHHHHHAHAIQSSMRVVDNDDDTVLAPMMEVAIQRPFAGLLGSDIPLTFPQKLMEVLANPQISNVITWLPHGKGFIILQKRKFALQVMPLYFKHSKFTSFTRKLNRWGFSRISRGPEMGAYYHKVGGEQLRM